MWSRALANISGPDSESFRCYHAFCQWRKSKRKNCQPSSCRSKEDTKGTYSSFHSNSSSTCLGGNSNREMSQTGELRSMFAPPHRMFSRQPFAFHSFDPGHCHFRPHSHYLDVFALAVPSSSFEKICEADLPISTPHVPTSHVWTRQRSDICLSNQFLGSFL